MKKDFKIYLEIEDYKALQKKAEEKGFYGRGAISRYIEMIAHQPIIFIDENIRSLFKVMQLKLE